MELIDIGVNLVHRRFAADHDAVIARAVAAGVSTMVITGTSVRASQEARALAARRRGTLWSTATAATSRRSCRTCSRAWRARRADRSARSPPTPRGSRARSSRSKLARMISGTARVRCPGCDREQECKLVQSLNTDVDAAAKAQLLAGELNVLACACGRKSQLAATVLFHDPKAAFWCQVCPGGDDAMAQGEAAFRASGTGGTQRLVPSLNALIEKVKIVDAGLEDWAIEMTKVLLLASRDGADLERILLFDAVDGEAIRWLLFEAAGPRIMASPLAAYTKLAARDSSRPPARELRLDRAWAIEAVRQMIAAGN